MYRGDPYGRDTIMYLDNCGGHNGSENLTAALSETKTKLPYFPPCSTRLVQPCDSFVISKIKDERKRLWEVEKMLMIRADEWSNAVRRDGAWSGKMKNPGKRFFLKLAAKAVQKVYEMRDVDGISYARKAMIRYGLSPDVSGSWHETSFPQSYSR